MWNAERGTTDTGRPPSRRWRREFALCVLNLALCTLTVLAGHDGPVKPDDPAYLRRQYAWFQSQTPARQQQLRKLHADFQALPPDEQARLTKVMQAYNAWLARPDVDRQRVLDAPDGAARLGVVRELREQEWVRSLPQPYREEYARLDGEARRQRVQEWRAEEADRREEWDLAQKHWANNPLPAGLGPLRAQFDAFVGHLRENLTEAERQKLDEARALADEQQQYVGYGMMVVALADRHPVLPGKVGPKNWAGLPEEVKTYLQNHEVHIRKKDKGPLLERDELKDVRRAQGRWPDFALELTKYCQKHGLQLPAPLGDCKKDQMPPEVIQFLDKPDPQLRKNEAWKADLKLLAEAEGKWPDYPRTIVELARKYRLPIPGWTLPGPAKDWEAFRAGRNRFK